MDNAGDGAFAARLVASRAGGWRVKLPTITEALFLGHNGLLGYRCDCGFVVSARTMDAFEASLIDHRRYRHLPSDEAFVDTEITE